MYASLGVIQEGLFAYARKRLASGLLCYDSLLTICRTYAPAEEDAQAILQQSFLKIFQHLDVLCLTQHSLRAWMHHIVAWTATEYLLKQDRMRNASGNGI